MYVIKFLFKSNFPIPADQSSADFFSMSTVFLKAWPAYTAEITQNNITIAGVSLTGVRVSGEASIYIMFHILIYFK